MKSTKVHKKAKNSHLWKFFAGIASYFGISVNQYVAFYRTFCRFRQIHRTRRMTVLLQPPFQAKLENTNSHYSAIILSNSSPRHHFEHGPKLDPLFNFFVINIFRYFLFVWSDYQLHKIIQSIRSVNF